MDIKGGILAVGTFTRWVALYSDSGEGEELDTFKLPEEVAGCGVTTVKWGSGGYHLYIAE